MLDLVLAHFPTGAHALTVVSDPDSVLADEGILAALTGRGFLVLSERQPVLLRHGVECARPWSVDHPLVVVTTDVLESLPYDLWQQGQRVTLALHAFFPTLSYPVVRALSAGQRWRLSQATPPPAVLGRQASIHFALRNVFGADLAALEQPAALLAWLSNYHATSDSMPAVFVECLLASLHVLPCYAGWSLGALLDSREGFNSFVSQQWGFYVQQQTGEPLSDGRAPYLLRFEENPPLQDVVSRLVRQGALSPVEVRRPRRLPAWARPAILKTGEDRRPRRAAVLMADLTGLLQRPAEELRWLEWQRIALYWAELTVLRYDPEVGMAPGQKSDVLAVQERIDERFIAWLSRRYASLGSLRLPVPHHVFHVPHYLAYQRRQGQADRVALLVLDGLALADWFLLGPSWTARHPDWRLKTQVLLAQVPTITAISRQALISGRRPAEFAASLDTNRGEAGQWTGFWVREGLPPEACGYARLGPAGTGEIERGGRALCLVDDSIDRMLHGACLGTADLHGSLHLWLEQRCTGLEDLIQELLARSYTVYVASDHGHCEATGMGQPQEGLTVQSRAKRARVYTDPLAAAAVQRQFTQTIPWGPDGVLPDYVRVLTPSGRQAFAPAAEVVVTHGGLTLDEVVVPLVTIARADG